MVAVTASDLLAPVVASTLLLFLVLLGAIGAKAGGAAIGRAPLRVTFWDALAILITAGIGILVGTVV
jgi:vacuolar iron transporter family protein